MYVCERVYIIGTAKAGETQREKANLFGWLFTRLHGWMESRLQKVRKSDTVFTYKNTNSRRVERHHTTVRVVRWYDMNLLRGLHGRLSRRS